MTKNCTKPSATKYEMNAARPARVANSSAVAKKMSEMKRFATNISEKKSQNTRVRRPCRTSLTTMGLTVSASRSPKRSNASGVVVVTARAPW